jgi:hypothetical protein
VIVQADAHDQLELLTNALTGKHDDWEKVSDL